MGSVLAWSALGCLMLGTLALVWLQRDEPPRDLVERLRSDLWGDGVEAAEEIEQLRAQVARLQAAGPGAAPAQTEAG